MDGLNKQEIEYRQNNGMVNNENIKNSRTVKQIILSNTITLFNILNLTLYLSSPPFSLLRNSNLPAYIVYGILNGNPLKIVFKFSLSYYIP